MRQKEKQKVSHFTAKSFTLQMEAKLGSMDAKGVANSSIYDHFTESQRLESHSTWACRQEDNAPAIMVRRLG